MDCDESLIFNKKAHKNKVIARKNKDFNISC